VVATVVAPLQLFIFLRPWKAQYEATQCMKRHILTNQRRLCGDKERIGSSWVVKVVQGGGHVASKDLKDGEGRGNVSTCRLPPLLPLPDTLGDAGDLLGELMGKLRDHLKEEIGGTVEDVCSMCLVVILRELCVYV